VRSPPPGPRSDAEWLAFGRCPAGLLVSLAGPARLSRFHRPAVSPCGMSGAPTCENVAILLTFRAQDVDHDRDLGGRVAGNRWMRTMDDKTGAAVGWLLSSAEPAVRLLAR